MSTIQMTTNAESNAEKAENIYEKTETMTSAGNGSTIILPDNTGKYSYMMVALITSGGSGKIQTTVSSRASVLAGNATWVDWDAGTVTVDTTDTLFPVSAVRQVNISGTTTIEVRVV